MVAVAIVFLLLVPSSHGVSAPKLQPDSDGVDETPKPMANEFSKIDACLNSEKPEQSLSQKNLVFAPLPGMLLQALARAEIVPSKAVMAVEQSKIFRAYAYDENGQPITSGITYSWGVDPGNAGTLWSGNEGQSIVFNTSTISTTALLRVTITAGTQQVFAEAIVYIKSFYDVVYLNKTKQNDPGKGSDPAFEPIDPLNPYSQDNPLNIPLYLIMLKQSQALNITLELKGPKGLGAPYFLEDPESRRVMTHFFAHGLWWDGMTFVPSKNPDKEPPWDQDNYSFEFIHPAPHIVRFTFNYWQRGDNVGGLMRTDTFFPPGSVVNWTIATRIRFPKNYLGLPQDNDVTFYTNGSLDPANNNRRGIYQYLVLGAWPHNGRLSGTPFEDNLLNYTTPEVPLFTDKVKITVEVRDEFKTRVKIGGGYVSAIVYYPPNKVAEGYPEQLAIDYVDELKPGENGLIANATFPEYAPGTDYIINVPGAYVKYNITIWEHCFPYPHIITSGSNIYEVSKSGIFPSNIFDENIEVQSSPDVTSDSSVIYRVDAGKPVNIVIRSRHSNVPIAKAYVVIDLESVPPPGTVGTKYSLKASRNQCTKVHAIEMKYTLAGQRIGTNISFFIEVYDINNAKLVSPRYRYWIPAPKSEEASLGMVYFYVRLKDNFTGRGLYNVLVTFQNTSYNSTTPTDPLGWAFPHEPENTYMIRPLTQGEPYTINFTYREHPENPAEKGFPIWINFTMPTRQQIKLEPRKLLQSGEFKSLFARRKIIYNVWLDNYTIQVFFNVPLPPPVYASIVPFGEWYLYMSIMTVCVMLGPVYMYLDRRRARAKEEEERITL